ncbi:MAG: hypothetical protein HYT40_00430 [Candidatus Sungbacteria bacterium]|uniref:R3H domain-containing protein n=1 Tax=Candidatus Sungiibacteriota bacterium TaxID=2750080 RepID=A0A931SB74_9BACT|nr:hypothetical protein [Candidatus Sungbacteria bacterium]
MLPTEYPNVIGDEIKKLANFLDPRAEVQIDESLYFGLRFNVLVSDARYLIGEHGVNLLYLEYLVKRIVQKKYPEAPAFNLDVNDYRLRRAESLRDEVKSVAKKVRMYRKEISLEPMTAFERRIIHVVLAEYPDITTESVGEGNARRVVIKPYP